MSLGKRQQVGVRDFAMANNQLVAANRLAQRKVVGPKAVLRKRSDSSQKRQRLPR